MFMTISSEDCILATGQLWGEQQCSVPSLLALGTSCGHFIVTHYLAHYCWDAGLSADSWADCCLVTAEAMLTVVQSG